MEIKVFSQACPPPAESEHISKQELKVLDKTSLTSVVDFMLKFQQDASFSPPSKDVLFDSDNYDIKIDDDGEFPEMFPDIESLSD